MTHTLFIQLPTAHGHEANEKLAWSLYDAQQQKIADGAAESIDAALNGDAQADRQVVALAPASAVLQTSITVSAGQQRHLQRTLPFLVEEDIASPIEAMHFAAGPVMHGQVQVLAVSHKTLQGWLEWLKAKQLEPDWLVPDSAALGLTNDLEILVDSLGARIHCANQPFIFSEPANLTFVADRLIAAFNPDSRPESGAFIVCKSLNESDQAAAEALAVQFEVEGIELQRTSMASSFDYQCQQLLKRLQQPASGLPVNLLCGDYRSASQRQRKNAPNWRALAAAIALCVGLKLLFDLGTGLYLHYQSNQLDNRVTTLYQELFPEDKRIVNVRVQMQSHLNQHSQTSNGSDFMLLLGQMAGAIQSLDSTQTTQIEQLRYNDQSQSLMVDLLVRDVQQLEQLKQSIGERNIGADILSANKEQQWIKGRLRLSL